ncbi:MAG: glucosylceramidase [Lachnospiraceae bacterium]|nr:glucosylceramidase [Lachnospiraceae bacterium]
MRKIKKIVTDYSKDILLKEYEAEEFPEKYACMQVINVYPDVEYQKIEGIGGALTEASAYTLSLMDEKTQNEIVEAYFGKDGIGYRLCRCHINSCDFALGNYAYVEDPEDTELKTFDISRDKKYIIPLIKKVQEKSQYELTFLASPWSPPAYMKTNGEMNHGGQLKKEFAHLWAKYMARFIKEYAKLGIKISKITVQNEPEATQTWDSCRYNAEEEAAFVRDHMGPVFEEEGLSDVEIYVWDHNKEIVFERARAIFADEDAAKYITGVAFHWYTGDHFEGVKIVNEKYPDKKLLFTEGCVEYSRFGDSGEVQKAEMYANDIIGNINAGAEGHIDWNIVLDEKGGPNHVHNYCAAPIMCDTKTKTYEKRLSFYYIGQISKFVKPGAVRVATTRYSDVVDVVAFKNPDGERVVVILNKSDKDAALTLREYDYSKDYTVAAHSIVTLVYDAE